MSFVTFLSWQLGELPLYVHVCDNAILVNKTTAAVVLTLVLYMLHVGDILPYVRDPFLIMCEHSTDCDVYIVVLYAVCYH